MRAYDLDLSRMNNEALIVLATECGYRPAWAELFSRQAGWKHRLIAKHAWASSRLLKNSRHPIATDVAWR